MTRRYSALDREMAAVICSIAACNEAHPHPYYSTIAADLGLCDLNNYATYPSCLQLALAAWATVWSIAIPWTADVDAEAEALIRTGWVPS